MNKDFSIEEMKSVFRTARIHCPGFTENMFESLMELEKHVTDSGYLEVIQGILRLEEEKGVKFTDAIKVCKDLIEQKTKLERLIPDLEKRVVSLTDQIKRALAEYERMQKTIASTQKDLVQVKNDYAAAEMKLVTFNKKLEKEKQRMEMDIERCRQEAEVSREDVTVTGQLKKEAENHGFSIEFMLNLAKEFAGHENASKELSEGLKKHTSIIKYLDELGDLAKKQKSTIEKEVNGLESGKKTLIEERFHLMDIILQLQADIKGEEELRRFYYRYVGISPLMEHLASWNQVFFARCTNPAYMVTGAFDANSGNARFWMDKKPVKCPQCGYWNLAYDEKVYQSIGWPVGQPVKFILGEYHV